MSGHSKWSTIKHQKAIEDKKRGKIFSKLAKVITVAVREGGADQETNHKLRVAIDQAKEANMPKDNIKRAIDRGAGGEKGGGLEEIIYEAYGPEKIALMVECITDNKNRTGSEIRSFFERNGGVIASPGAVSYLFKRQGMLLVEKEKDFENQALQLIDLDIEDFSEAGELVEVYTQPAQLEEIKRKIIKAGFRVKQADLSYKPVNSVSVADPEKKKKLLNFLNELDELDDVQKIYCNADFLDE